MERVGFESTFPIRHSRTGYFSPFYSCLDFTPARLDSFSARQARVMLRELFFSVKVARSHPLIETTTT